MLIKVCDKCGKVKYDKNVTSEEKCKYCGGKMIARGIQQSAKAGWGRQ
jgi:DNA-directed RNA polymerase subunit RPC12/RpoP